MVRCKFLVLLNNSGYWGLFCPAGRNTIDTCAPMYEIVKRKVYLFRPGGLVLMAVKIFVGNLPFSMNDDRLKEEFSKFGAVESAKIVTEKHTGRSRGYGFVEFTDQASADAAIKAMNGLNFENRPLTVSIAKGKQGE